MIKTRRTYISPSVEFEDIEFENGVCNTFTGSAHGQEGEDGFGGNAKSNTYFCLDGAFDEEIEEEKKEMEFEYSLEQNW